jgi:hypothetical protein
MHTGRNEGLRDESNPECIERADLTNHAMMKTVKAKLVR